jgi:hypothetical protein
MLATLKLEESKQKEIRKQQRKQKYKQMKMSFSSSGGRAGVGGNGDNEGPPVSQEDVTDWTLLMQSKLSLAYELICGLFDDVQTLHATYAEENGVSKSSDPNSQKLLDQYIGHLDRLFYELQYLHAPEGHLSAELLEEVEGWEGDARQCCAVLQGLKEILFLLSPVGVAFTPNQLLFPVGNVLSALQMSDDGVPYDLVFWEGGVARCPLMVQYAKDQAKAFRAVSTNAKAGEVQSGARSPAVHGVPPFSPIRPNGAGSGGEYLPLSPCVPLTLSELIALCPCRLATYCYWRFVSIS